MIKLINSDTKEEIMENREALINLVTSSLSPFQVMDENATISIPSSVLENFNGFTNNGALIFPISHCSVGFNIGDYKHVKSVDFINNQK